MTTRINHPEVLDDLEFLARAAEIIFDLEEIHHGLARSEKQEALAAAEREASRWEGRRQAQMAACADVAACSDARCRRSKSCTTLRWIAAKAEAARRRLAVEQAKWPTPEPEHAPAPRADKKKGRTGVRP